MAASECFDFVGDGGLSVFARHAVKSARVDLRAWFDVGGLQRLAIPVRGSDDDADWQVVLDR